MHIISSFIKNAFLTIHENKSKIHAYMPASRALGTISTMSTLHLDFLQGEDDRLKYPSLIDTRVETNAMTAPQGTLRNPLPLE